MARQPGHEARFAEIRVMLSANRVISERDVDALEEAIGIAPKLVDNYLLLARCYQSWKDRESALKTLNDALQHVGEHPRISQSLAQMQWRGGDRQAAIDALNRSLADFPNDVGLLAQLAAFLLENGQTDDARAYIARAESIAPSHQAVWQLRRLVADSLSR